MAKTKEDTWDLSNIRCYFLLRMDPCGEDGRWGAVAQGGAAGSGKVHDLLAQGRRGGQPTTCDQTTLS